MTWKTLVFISCLHEICITTFFKWKFKGKMQKFYKQDKSVEWCGLTVNEGSEPRRYKYGICFPWHFRRMLFIHEFLCHYDFKISNLCCMTNRWHCSTNSCIGVRLHRVYRTEKSIRVGFHMLSREPFIFEVCWTKKFTLATFKHLSSLLNL